MTGIQDRDRILSSLLSASALRERVLAENVANQSVPGYQRQVVQFEDALRARLQRGQDLQGLAPRVETDAASPAGPDGNNVSLELETSALRENWLAYQLYAQMLQSRIGLVQAAITESR